MVRVLVGGLGEGGSESEEGESVEGFQEMRSGEFGHWGNVLQNLDLNFGRHQFHHGN